MFNMAEYQKVWRVKNHERIRHYQRLWIMNHPGYGKKMANAWRRKNKNKIKVIKRKYNSERRQIILHSSVTPDDLKGICKKYDWKCAYCGNAIKIRTHHGDPHGFDHVVALKFGGKHEVSNIVPSCKTCNVSKGRGFSYI